MVPRGFDFRSAEDAAKTVLPVEAREEEDGRHEVSPAPKAIGWERPTSASSGTAPGALHHRPPGTAQRADGCNVFRHPLRIDRVNADVVAGRS